MDIDALIWLAGALLIAGVRLARSRPRPLAADLARLSWRWRLPISDGVAVTARHRLRRRAFGEAMGVASVTIAGAISWALGAQLTPGFYMVAILAMIPGAFVADSWHVLAPAQGPRVAHPRAVALSDLCPTWWLATAGVSAASALVTCAVVVAGAGAAGSVWQPSEGAIAGISVVVAALGWALLLRRALTMPRSAHSDLELAWQDGFAARLVVEATGMMAVVGLTVLAAAALAPWSGDDPLPSLALALGSLGLAQLLGRQDYGFRTKLWGDRLFTEADVAEPGEPYPSGSLTPPLPGTPSGAPA